MALDMQYYSAMKIVRVTFRNEREFPTIGIAYKPIEFVTEVRYNLFL